MNDGLTAEQRAFFDALDEMPCRRAGGRVISMEWAPAKRGKSEFRSRAAFHRLNRCKAQLAEIEARMLREEL